MKNRMFHGSTYSPSARNERVSNEMDLAFPPLPSLPPSALLVCFSFTSTFSPIFVLFCFGLFWFVLFWIHSPQGLDPNRNSKPFFAKWLQSWNRLGSVLPVITRQQNWNSFPKRFQLPTQNENKKKKGFHDHNNKPNNWVKDAQDTSIPLFICWFWP